jgi:hypothetical protein
MHTDFKDLLIQLTVELENFEETAKYLIPKPGEVPRLKGIDIFGGTLALNGSVGGDHLIYVDFKKRFDLEARIQHGTEEGRLEVVENLKRCQKWLASPLSMYPAIGLPTRWWRLCCTRLFSWVPSMNWTCSGR